MLHTLLTIRYKENSGLQWCRGIGGWKMFSGYKMIPSVKVLISLALILLRPEMEFWYQKH